MKIEEVMTPGPRVLPTTATASEAAQIMLEEGVGGVIVRDNKGHLYGIVTDRDLVLRVLATDQDPQAVPLKSVCTRDPVCLAPDDEVSVAVRLMKNHAVRRVPVLEGDRIVGIVSLGDLATVRDPRSALGKISAAPFQL